MDSNQIILNDFITKHPFAAAKALEVLGHEDVVEFLLALPSQKGLRMLSLMNPKNASKCLVLIPAKQRVEYLEKGNPSAMAAILRMIDNPLHDELLRAIAPGKAVPIKRELEFKPNTVGPFADPAMTVHKATSVDNAVDMLKKERTSRSSELYVVDLDGIFQGLVETTELLRAERADIVETIMVKTCPRFSADQPIKSVLHDDAWLQYRQVPVVDRADKFIGTLSFKAVMAIEGKPEGLTKDSINETAGALGELYRIGLTSLLQSTGK